MTEPKSNSKFNLTLLFILLLSALIIMVILAIFYQELYQEDSYAHYLLAKYAWGHPRLFIDIWARPIPTLFLSFAAPFGIIPAKILTILISLICVFFTYKTAQIYKIEHAEFAVPFLIFQPYFLLLSVNPLTEIFFATFLIVTVLLFLQNRYLASAICCSLLPLIRPEGFFLLLFWFILLIIKKKWRLVPFLVVGLIIWNLLSFIRTGQILWLYHNFPWSGQTAFYGSGNFSHYFDLLPKITGWFILPFFIIGIAYLIKRKKFLLVSIFAYFFILHTILWKYGLFKSAGYARYFVSIAPVIGIIGLSGYNFLSAWLQRRCSLIILSVFSIMLVITSISSVFKIQPRNLNSDHQLLHEVNAYYKSLQSDAPLVCAYNYFFYIGKYDRYDFPNYPYPHLDSIRMHLDNSVVIWDSIYMQNQYGIFPESLSNLNFTEIKSFRSDNNYYPIKIFKSR
jgi:hypothetical protein